MDKSAVYMDQAENFLLHTYNRYRIVLEKGEGVYLYDVEGKKYLDFAAGIAVQSLGYGNEAYNQALKNQIDQLCHTSNLFYNTTVAKAAAKLSGACGMERVFFTNSGTEAIEGALKAARKYAYKEEGTGRYEMIAMEHSFHGRSMGALSVTGNAHYREAFEPLIGGVKFAVYNDLESVRAQVTDKTCAIIMETVQGEGGIYPADEQFLLGVKKICEENDILLILDEIQCGMGRCGTMFAWQEYGVRPDIMTCAKALGCGVPVGAFVMTQKVADRSLAPGDHGTTYGGNPLVCAAVNAVFDIYEKEHILDRVKETGSYLEQRLDAMAEKYSCIMERRGKGLLQGLAFAENVSAGRIVERCLEAGLIVITAGGNVLRMVPPLIITKGHVDEMAEILESCLDQEVSVL